MAYTHKKENYTFVDVFQLSKALQIFKKIWQVIITLALGGHSHNNLLTVGAGFFVVELISDLKVGIRLNFSFSKVSCAQLLSIAKY